MRAQGLLLAVVLGAVVLFALIISYPAGSMVMNIMFEQMEQHGLSSGYIQTAWNIFPYFVPIIVVVMILAQAMRREYEDYYYP